MTENVKLIADYGIIAGAFIYMLWQFFIDRKRLLDIISKYSEALKENTEIIRMLKDEILNMKKEIEEMRR